MKSKRLRLQSLSTDLLKGTAGGVTRTRSLGYVNCTLHGTVFSFDSPEGCPGGGLSCGGSWTGVGDDSSSGSGNGEGSSSTGSTNF